MIYLTATFIDVKKGQDRAIFVTDPVCGLLLCDGIGSLKNSKEYAKEAIGNFEKNPTISILELASEIQQNLKSPGGTTVLKALVETTENTTPNLLIECLGNGSVVHLTGHFNAERPDGLPPYRYSELFLSHTNQGTTLVRHISQDSGDAQHEAFSIKISLNHPYGDIFLFFTDGLSSSEERFVLKAADGRMWRNESTELHLLLQALDSWLRDLGRTVPEPKEIQSQLVNFSEQFVAKMKAEGHLDDDLALGIILTDGVIRSQVRMHEKMKE